MALIRIQECSEQAGIFQAKVSFSQGPEYAVAVSDPFSKEEEERLEWYFEEHLKYPFTDHVKAQGAARSVITYGERLFTQVFASEPQILAAYENAAEAGLNSLQIEIVGRPSFHAFHWEALKNPKATQPLALQAAMVRKSGVSQNVPTALRPSPVINLLIVTARPRGKQDVGYRTISRPLVESLNKGDLPVKIDILRPGTYKALDQHLRAVTEQHGTGYYQVIHFDVHGSLLAYRSIPSRVRTKRDGRNTLHPYEGVKAFLFLETEKDNSEDLLEATELAQLLRSHQIPIIILNACQSSKQIGERETSLASHLMQSGVQVVLGMGYSITVTAAQSLMETLYQQLFEGQELATALSVARGRLHTRKGRRAYYNQEIQLEDWLLPVIYQNQAVYLNVQDHSLEEKAHQEHQEERYTPPQPQYGFIGRDLDILRIEKRLLSKRNILLVRGMGGTGKTTLLRHLGAWWQTTSFADQVMYFGYDEKAWTLQQILVNIAKQVLDEEQFSAFQPLDLKKKQAMLTHHLRTQRHLLILDNLESITGENLAIQHPLQPKARSALHHFLIDLVDGRTLVLLGSRSGETWLATGTFADNVYDLPGLDLEAASELADRILERHNATKYRREGDLLKLLKLLDGFPLALEVVLANLAHQTPKEILASLQAGDIDLDTSDSRKKTESVLQCIDYSHSNLSSEAQALLVCLAPFTSVIWLNLLEPYTTYLRDQPALAKLPFKRMPEVIQEARNWGLLSPDPLLPEDYFRLQPILPYFLRSRLNVQGQSDVRQAIEAAFRELYSNIGGSLYALLDSRDPEEQLFGQVLIGLEYENLVTALQLALTAQVSIQGIHSALSTFLRRKQDVDHGLELSRTTLSILETYPIENRTDTWINDVVTTMAVITDCQINLRQYAEASDSLRKQLSLLRESKHIPGVFLQLMIGDTYNQLGLVARHQRQWMLAEQYHKQALQTFVEISLSKHQDLPDSSLETFFGQERPLNYDSLGAFLSQQQGLTYNSLGQLALEQGQLEQAEQYYQQALRAFTDSNERYEQAHTYHQLGIVAQEQEKWEQAAGYFLQALHNFGDFNNPHEQARVYTHLGIVACKQQQWNQAEAALRRALELFIRFDDRHEEAIVYLYLGIAAQGQEQWEQAEEYYLQALRIYIDFDNHFNQAGVYYQLGTMAQERQQWKRAYACFLRALKIYTMLQDTKRVAGLLGSLAQSWLGEKSLAPIELGRILNVPPHQAQSLLYFARKKANNGSDVLEIDLNDFKQERLDFFDIMQRFAEEADWSTGYQMLPEGQVDTLQRQLEEADWSTGCQILSKNRKLLASTYLELAIDMLINMNSGNSVLKLDNLRTFVRRCHTWGIDVAWFLERRMPFWEDTFVPAEFEADIIHIAELLIRSGEDSTAIERAIETAQTLLSRLPTNIPCLFKSALVGNLAHMMLSLPANHPARNLDLMSIYYREALACYQAAGRLSDAISIQFGLGKVLYEQGHLEETLEPLEAVIQQFQANKQYSEGAAFALSIYASVLDGLGRADEALMQYADAMKANPQAAQSYRSRAEVPIHVLWLARTQAGLEQGVTLDEEKVELFGKELDIKESSEDLEKRAATLYQSGTTAKDQGKFEEARLLYNESLAIFSQLGDQRNRASTLHQLGIVAQHQQKYDEARQLFGESLAIKELLGDQGARANTLVHLGTIALIQEDYEEARRLYTECLGVYEQLHKPRERAQTLAQLGIILLKQRDYEEARRQFKECLSAFERLGDEPGRALALYYLGVISREQVDYKAALLNLVQALSIFERLHSRYRDPTLHAIMEIQTELGEAAFVALWKEISNG